MLTTKIYVPNTFPVFYHIPYTFCFQIIIYSINFVLLFLNKVIIYKVPNIKNVLFIILETKNSMIIAPNMCPFKGEIIEQLNEAKRKEREIRISNFESMETQSVEENKNSTEPEKLPFRKKWILKETREKRYAECSFKKVEYCSKATVVVVK